MGRAVSGENPELVKLCMSCKHATCSGICDEYTALANGKRRTKRGARLLTVNGVSRTVREWAEANGINANTIYDRLLRGYSAEIAVSPNRISTVSVYEYGGETHTLSEWCEITGISRDALYGRMRVGMNFKQAIEGGKHIKPKRFARKYEAFGKVKTLPEWGKILGLTWGGLYYHLRQGRTVEDVLRMNGITEIEE